MNFILSGFNFSLCEFYLSKAEAAFHETNECFYEGFITIEVKLDIRVLSNNSAQRGGVIGTTVVGTWQSCEITNMIHAF